MRAYQNQDSVDSFAKATFISFYVSHNNYNKNNTIGTTPIDAFLDNNNNVR